MFIFICLTKFNAYIHDIYFEIILKPSVFHANVKRINGITSNMSFYLSVIAMCSNLKESAVVAKTYFRALIALKRKGWTSDFIDSLFKY